jgi:hypothetical protein
MDDDAHRRIYNRLVRFMWHYMSRNTRALAIENLLTVYDRSNEDGKKGMDEVIWCLTEGAFENVAALRATEGRE